MTWKKIVIELVVIGVCLIGANVGNPSPFIYWVSVGTAIAVGLGVVWHSVVRYRARHSGM